MQYSCRKIGHGKDLNAIIPLLSNQNAFHHRRLQCTGVKRCAYLKHELATMHYGSIPVDHFKNISMKQNTLKEHCKYIQSNDSTHESELATVK